jgi:hypothetical protein
MVVGHFITCRPKRLTFGSAENISALARCHDLLVDNDGQSSTAMESLQIIEQMTYCDTQELQQSQCTKVEMEIQRDETPSGIFDVVFIFLIPVILLRTDSSINHEKISN